MRDLLQAAGARLGLEGALETGLLWTRWSEIVGDATAAHAEPTSLKAGVLRIRTDSPTWATEVGYLKDEIRARANRVVGRALVSEVRVWTSPDPVKTARTEVKPPRPNDHGEASEATSEVAFDGDPDVALARAREAWEKRRSGSSSEGFRKP
ncbi:MAG: DUF721 domain-containing protein [Actinomycetota bacterium]|nr:DUF721 domain-containing protein [Actinomycetota bacterium]